MALAKWNLDRLFLGLLALEAGITAIFLADIGLGQPFGQEVHLLFDFRTPGSLPTALAAGQLLLIGLVFAMAARSRPVSTAPTRPFLYFSAGVFLLLALLVAPDHHPFFSSLVAELTVLHSIPWLGPALFATVLLLHYGRRSLAVMWRCYPIASQSMLAGLWVLLFGAVGLEVLQAFFLGSGAFQFVPTALEKFLEMAGASVILYGAALFARQAGFRTALAAARC